VVESLGGCDLNFLLFGSDLSVKVQILFKAEKKPDAIHFLGLRALGEKPVFDFARSEHQVRRSPSMKTTEPFHLQIEGPVAWLTLNRPEQRNTMDLAFFDALAKQMAALDTEPAVRAVVLKADGKSFTAGLDLMAAGSLVTDTAADAREVLRRAIGRMQESFCAIEGCRKPVIAAIHGHCIGGGVDMACACDIRLATEDAVFGIRETRMAMVADLGTLQRLPHIIGYGWSRELALTGRDFSAAEALQMGFVTNVCAHREDLYEAAGNLARQVAENAPLAVQGAKEVLTFSRDHGVDAGLAFVAQKNAAVLQSEDLMEAITAFMDKRPPSFKGK
jgi:enoyl-CoA hydratase/carnithine racemase